MPEFIPGLELSESFYHEVVRPILDKHLPGLSYSAGLIGKGAEVLGYDTLQSTDHDWGPRVLLFCTEEDYAQVSERITATMSQELPYEFRGYSTHFIKSQDGAQVMKTISKGPINHKVEVTTIRRFFRNIPKIDPFAEICALDWLTFSEQALLRVTAGKVFHDGLDELKAIREKFAYYPEDIWRYLLAAQWARIGQEEAFVGRCGDVGDELGSQIIAARLVRDLMRLCFLMEKRYAPYPKWYGTAFSQLACANKLTPILESVLNVSNWREREHHLSRAYETIARMHNDLGITDPFEATVSQFYDRPYLVINGDRFVEAIRATIQDETVKRLPKHIGSVDQFSDSTDLICSWRRKSLKALYTPHGST